MPDVSVTRISALAMVVVSDITTAKLGLELVSAL